MMANDGSESARDNFGKFIHQFQHETKTLIRKLERILNKSMLLLEEMVNMKLVLYISVWLKEK